MLSKQFQTAYSSSAWKLGNRLTSTYHTIASSNIKNLDRFRQDTNANIHWKKSVEDTFICRWEDDVKVNLRAVGYKDVKGLS